MSLLGARRGARHAGGRSHGARLREHPPLVPVGADGDPERCRPASLFRPDGRARARPDDPLRRHLLEAQARPAAHRGVRRGRAPVRCPTRGSGWCATDAPDRPRASRCWAASPTTSSPTATGGPGCSACRAPTRASACPTSRRMASGTPVVATPNVGAREVLDEGRFGVLVRRRRPGRRPGGAAATTSRVVPHLARGRLGPCRRLRLARAWWRVRGHLPGAHRGAPPSWRDPPRRTTRVALSARRSARSRCGAVPRDGAPRACRGRRAPRAGGPRRARPGARRRGPSGPPPPGWPG